MAYDPTRGYVVLFGGNSAGFVGGPAVFDENGSVIDAVGDTWLWQGNPTGGSWQQKFPSNPKPCPRTSPTLAWDAAKGRVMMFGGLSGPMPPTPCANGAYNDTWTWDGTKWKQCTTCGTPPTKRFAHRMEWDPDNVLGAGPQVVMFGGSTAGGVLNHETWAIDGGMWQQCLSPNCTTFPSIRCCVGLSYFPNSDPTKKGLILYGGQDMGAPDGSHRELSGTWRFDGTNWSCITTCD
jgi:hypothetical protein